MSAVIETFIMCDGCSCNYGVDFRSLTVGEHRKRAKREGWIQFGSKDFCETCAKDKELFQRIKHTI